MQVISDQQNPYTEAIATLLDSMSLAEKIGQMTQVEKNSITPADVRDYAIGSILSGGGGNPAPNNPQNWADMVRSYAEAALQSRLQIPLIYGVDAVHGHNNCHGATIFPHNIGLGATRDPLLVERIGAITAREMLANHVHWDFAPCLAVPQDLRWGRTYEGYGADPGLVAQLGAAFTRGLQSEGAAACIKHYVGDGGTEWNTRKRLSWLDFWEQAGGFWRIDQGDVNVDEATLRRLHLTPYLAGLEAGALTVMASFNSWRGHKLHGYRYLLTDVLKGELGFKGFIVSDWMGINQLSPDLYTTVMQGINAGLDMVMVPFDYKAFISTLTQAVEKGDVPMSRIDDAVRRILWVKMQLGLFDDPIPTTPDVSVMGSAEHRAVAREAVRKSAVLLKNENSALPLPADQSVLLAGVAADDLGLQCGGWTIEWLGIKGNQIPGTTLRQALSERLSVSYSADGDFSEAAGQTAVIVIAEQPYAEGVGDREDLALPDEDVELIRRVREQVERLVLVIYSGRPLLLDRVEPLCDAIVAAWLPGTEGDGLADVLCGEYPFTGRLSHDWIASMDQLPRSALMTSDLAPLYPYGHGLTT